MKKDTKNKLNFKIDFKNLNFFELAGFVFLIIGFIFAIASLKDYLNPTYLIDTMKANDGVTEVAPNFTLALGFVASLITTLVFVVLSLFGKTDFKRGLSIVLIVLLVDVLSYGMTLINELSKSAEFTTNYAFFILSGLVFAGIAAAWYFNNPKDLTKLIIYSIAAALLIAKDIIRLVASFNVYFVFEMVAIIVIGLGFAPFPFNKKKPVTLEEKEEEQAVIEEQ